jgi:hypothetical protein
MVATTVTLAKVTLMIMTIIIVISDCDDNDKGKVIPVLLNEYHAMKRTGGMEK